MTKDGSVARGGTRGKLVLGGIGTLLLGAAIVILSTMSSPLVVSLALGVGAVLAFVASVGWRALADRHGGVHSVAAAFWIVLGTGQLLSLLGLVADVAILFFVGQLGAALGLMFGAISSGVALLAGGARRSLLPLRLIAGIVLMLGGAASLWSFLFLVSVKLPLMAPVTSIAVWGTAAGLVLAGVTLLATTD
ncbi:MAG: hypothetical protein U1F43_03000 [Myxococcota bacterium]